MTSPYAARKVFPDGRHAGVTPQLFNAIIWVGPDPEVDGGFNESFTFETTEAAVVALAAWDGTGEPQGWIRHQPSNRRRKNGDPQQGYVSA